MNMLTPIRAPDAVDTATARRLGPSISWIVMSGRGPCRIAGAEADSQAVPALGDAQIALAQIDLFRTLAGGRGA